MKVRQIVDEKFKKTVAKLLDQDMPLKTVLVLKGVVDLLNAELEKYETARQKLLNKFGQKDSEGKLMVGEDKHVQFDPEQLVAYSKAYNHLCDKEVEVPVLAAQEFGDNVKLSHSDLLNLNGLVT